MGFPPHLLDELARVFARAALDRPTQSPHMPSKPVNVKPVLVHLTHDQHAALLKLKGKNGVPVSVRERSSD